MRSDETHWWDRGRRRVLRAELDRLPALRAAPALPAPDAVPEAVAA